jgi:hypothetical protein
VTIDEALALPRVAICGPARTGKTTLASTVTDGREVVHTDDFIGILPKTGGGAIIAESLADKTAFVLEGVKAGNALRAGLEVDAVIWLSEPKAEWQPGHSVQAKGCRTVFDEWLAADGGKTPVVEE